MLPEIVAANGPQPSRLPAVHSALSLSIRITMDEIQKHRLDPDMSEPALNRRIHRLGELHDLALSLKTARPVTPLHPAAVHEKTAPDYSSPPGSDFVTETI